MRKLFPILILALLVQGGLWAQYSITVTEDEENTAAAVLPVDEYFPEDFAGFTDVEAFLASLPGFKTILGGSVSVKGLGETSYASFGVFLNGQKMAQTDLQAFPLNSIPLEAIRKIEVIASSASHVFGDSTQAGGINLIFWEDYEEDGFRVRVSGDSFLGYGARFIGTSSGLGQFQLLYEQSPGQRESDQNQIVNAFYSHSFWDWSFQTVYNMDFGNNPGSISQAEYEADPNQSNNDEDRYSDQLWSISLGSPTEEAWGLAYGFSLRGTTFDTTSFGSFTDKISLAHDLSVEYLLGGEDLNLRASASGSLVSYGWEKFTDASKDTLQNELDFFRLVGGGGLNVFWKPLDAWSLSLGGRADGLFLDTQGSIAVVKGQKSNWAYSLGMIMAGDLGPLGYNIAGSKGFRFPLIDELLSFSFPGFESVVALDPEDTLELRGEVNLALPEISIFADGFITQNNGEIYFNGIENANGESLRYGAGGGIQWLGEILELSLGYQFLEGEREEEKIPLLAPHKVSSTIAFLAVDNLRIKAAGSYQSDYYLNLGGMDHARIDLGVNLSYEIQEPKLIINVDLENLLNERIPEIQFFSGYYPKDGFSATVSLEWLY